MVFADNYRVLRNFFRSRGALGSHRTLVLLGAGILGAGLLVACGGGGGDNGPAAGAPTTPIMPPAVNGPPWWGFARDAQHTAVGAIATQALNRVLWRTPVDLAPQYSGGDLFIHYGVPVITAKNTVVVPVKTGATSGFRVEARSGADGSLKWSMDSSYVLPAHRWVPSFNVVLTQANRLYVPTAGGRLQYRDDTDTATQTTSTGFGIASFYTATAADQATYDANVLINTPLTADAQGNIYFGFVVTGATPANLVSGIARISATGAGSWVSAASAAGDSTIGKMAMNSAPAISADGKTIYVAANMSVLPGAFSSGYLLALDSTTLATKAKVRLNDPKTGAPAWITDDSTASPTVGPDGDVYYGVLESNTPGHNFRGWLLHFDSALAQTKTPGSFGWDDTVSVVPATMVPSYTGGASYLLVSKYNNYGGAGSGDGKNRIAILDPTQSQADSISGAPVMKEILTILGPTADSGYPGGVKEWCINTAAVDPLTRSVLANSEDGYLYRWDLSTNTFTQRFQLDSGVGEAYTPTLIGPDGVVYAVNNATLFAIGQ